MLIKHKLRVFLMPFKSEPRKSKLKFMFIIGRCENAERRNFAEYCGIHRNMSGTFKM